MNNPLNAIISDEIRHSGPVPFRRFMELALYHPEFGYYENAGRLVGKSGDFFTSVSTGRVFGDMLGFQFAEWSEAFDRFQIVEAGAHDGQLAFDILSYLRDFRKDLFSRLEYQILEPSRCRAERQRRTLAEFSEHTSWRMNWESMPTGSIQGVVLSNELLDAFPVHRLGWDAGSRCWFEWGVGLNNHNFVWEKITAEPQMLREFLLTTIQCNSMPDHLAEILPDGFSVEYSPDGNGWWNQASSRLHRGKLITLDYGFEAAELFAPERASGTLRAYRHHQVSGNLLDYAGEQDITASVNFTSLIRCGEERGLATEQFSTQEKFLTGVLKRTEERKAVFPDWTPERLRQLKTLTHPDHLGCAFKVLVQVRTVKRANRNH